MDDMNIFSEKTTVLSLRHPLLFYVPAGLLAIAVWWMVYTSLRGVSLWKKKDVNKWLNSS